MLQHLLKSIVLHLRRILKTYVHLVNIVYSGKTVKLQVHGIEHGNNLDGFTLRADVGEGHHIAEENSALFKLT